MSNLQLFVACVAIWGSTWLAITFQLGSVAPEASVAWRFLLASTLLFAYCLVRRLSLRYTLREHAGIALQGILMFSASYIAVYYAEQNVVSGLVAVGYSASPLLGMLGMRLLFRTPMTHAVIAGSILGIAGVVLVFWPEFGLLRGDRRTAVGAAFTAAAVVLSTLGSMAAHRNQEGRIPLWQGMAWAMLYGALFSLAVALAAGKPVAFSWTAPYLLSLAYLAVFGSIVAFAGYLTLIRRMGVARSGYIGVMVPIVALAVSAAFEGFRWHALTGIGIAVSVAGNVVVLRERART
ncbi:MAG TPA: EamA family transporter [Usitatibacter sp.]|nr:EamA family transporter [Usitatibacter sp.]